MGRYSAVHSPKSIGSGIADSGPKYRSSRCSSTSRAPNRVCRHRPSKMWSSADRMTQISMNPWCADMYPLHRVVVMMCQSAVPGKAFYISFLEELRQAYEPARIKGPLRPSRISRGS